MSHFGLCRGLLAFCAVVVVVRRSAHLASSSSSLHLKVRFVDRIYLSSFTTNERRRTSDLSPDVVVLSLGGNVASMYEVLITCEVHYTCIFYCLSVQVRVCVLLYVNYS